MLHSALLAILLLLSFSPNSVYGVTTILGGDNTVTAPFIEDAVLAYQLQQPDVVLSVTTSPSGVNVDMVFAQQVDFGITSSGLTTLQQSLHPTVNIYPFIAAALVPVYRLDVLGTEAPPVVFTREVLARIFIGNITRWNDPAMVLANPTIVLPNQPMTIVLESDSTAVNSVFTDALCSFYTPACTAVPTSSLPTWPLANYSAYASGSGVTGLASTVTTIDGSVGYAVLAAALDAQATVGNIVNRAGRTVVGSSSSVTFAVAELATQTTTANSAINLNDASGPSAWPICVMSYLVIDSAYTRDTCAIRSATVNFWLFILQSTVVGKLADSREYAMLPDIVMDELNVENDLTNGILCGNVPAVQQVNTAQVTIAGSSRLSFLLGLLTNLYSRTDASVNYVYSATTSQVAFDQLVAGEVDVGIYFDGEVSAASLSAATASGDFLIFPAFLVAIAPVFNPQITPTVNVGSTQLVLDFSTFIRMILYNVTTWQDPDILALNPTLASALGNQSAPLTLVIGCGTTAELINTLYGVGLTYAAQYDPKLLQTIYTVLGNTTVVDDFDDCINLPHEKVTPNEFTVPSVVNALTGAVGYKQDNTADNTGKFILRIQTSGGQVAQTTSSPANQETCLSDTFNPNTLTANLGGSHNVNCWPYTTVVYAAVRTSYISKSATSTGCTLGLKALQYVSWLNSNVGLDLATNAQNVVRAGDQASVQSAINSALDKVMCDGTTMLITLPDVWSLSAGAAGFGMALAVIGLIGVLAALTLIVLYRAHPVMKSASVWFLFTSIAGVGLLFIALILLMSSVTSATCAAFNWMLNMGFMLTFAPLFAKTWRIYRIFGRKKLSVVKVSNRKLAAMVSALVLIDIILMSIWQAVSPLGPKLTVVTSGSPPVDHDYTQCSVSGDGLTFLIIEAVSKGALLLYGALLAFSTRRVSDNFNESQSIAWAIYNVVFSVGIVTPIIIFIGATGDILILLMTFVMGWIAYFTASILVVPKFITIFSANSEHVALSTTGAKSSVDGFDFISVENFENPSLLRSYVNALNQQLTYAKQRLAALTRGSVAESKISPSTPVGPEKVAMAPINRQTSNLSSNNQFNAVDSPSRTPVARAPIRVQHGHDSLTGSSSRAPVRLAQSSDAALPDSALAKAVSNIRLPNEVTLDAAKTPLVTSNDA